MTSQISQHIKHTLTMFKDRPITLKLNTLLMLKETNSDEQISNKLLKPGWKYVHITQHHNTEQSPHILESTTRRAS